MSQEPHADIKKAIWAYFLLVIFEGAFRKWVAPGLATPLLIIRDPIVLWVLVQAIQRRLLPTNGYIVSMWLVSIVSFFLALLLGHGNIGVALFGIRITMFHFPFMFVMGSVLSREDVIKIGKATLLIAIPMTLLIGLQFYSPRTAFVNLGVGGIIEDGFTGANGFSRPPGTFSFTSGNSLFFGLVACYVFYFLLEPKEIKRYLLLSGTIALVIAMPLSISRSLFSEVLVSLAFTFVVLFRRPKYFGKFFAAIVFSAGSLFVLSKLSFFATATEALTSRFDAAASGSEGGNAFLAFCDRLFGGIAGAIIQSSNLPLFGLGLGMGTNVGAILLTGESIFLISEGEWGRVIGEQGLFLGAVVILTRVAFTIDVVKQSYKKMVKKGDVLPWMLLSYAFLTLSQAQFGQPTALGFSTLIGGLLLAALRSNPKQTV